MANNSTSSLIPPAYRLFIDDIEEIFLDRISMKFFVYLALLLSILTMFNFLVLFYRSSKIFLGSFIPFIYALVFYDCIQFISLFLLKSNIWSFHPECNEEFCRWPLYLKSSSEAGQCLTLILILFIRRQKLRYFLKNHQLTKSSQIHSRALSLVIFLFIIYANNWITHLKVEKVHLITINDSNNETIIREYPLTFYSGSSNGSKHRSSETFYDDLTRYATQISFDSNRTLKSEKIIHKQRDGSIHEVIIKIPIQNFYPSKESMLNRTRRKFFQQQQRVNQSAANQKSYGVHRCTFGQRNFFLANTIFLIFNWIYLLLISFSLRTGFHEEIPRLTIAYHRKLYDRDLSMGRKRSADQHQQIILLGHLKYFQYFIIYFHSIFIIIRLLYNISLIVVLWSFPSPFHWPQLQFLFHFLFLLVYSSIPLRILLLFIYLSITLMFPSIRSIFHYIFHTKLHFSWRLEKPSIRFQFHFSQLQQENYRRDERLSDAFILDVNSPIFDDYSIAIQNQSFVVYDETTRNSTAQITNPSNEIQLSERRKSVM